MRQHAAVHVHPTELGTTRERGYGLSGVQQLRGIEHFLDGVNHRELVRVELRTHLLQLLDTDAMLTRDGAANGYTKAQDFAAETLCLLELLGHVGVVQDERVQIAVSGMKDVGNTQTVAGREARDVLQYSVQAGAWNRAVPAVGIG